MEGLAAYRGRRHTRPKQQTEQQQENGIYLYKNKTRIRRGFSYFRFSVCYAHHNTLMEILCISNGKEFALVFLLV